MNFKVYTDCIFYSFSKHAKSQELIKRKQDILIEISKFHNLIPESILYIGFNPAILSDPTPDIYVTLIGDEAAQLLQNKGIKFTKIDFNNLGNYSKKFDVVVALDEFFTFASDDAEQKNLVTLVSEVTKEYLVTTCKDYKNQEFKEKEFSIPAIIRNDELKTIYLEFHDYDIKDKNLWATEVFEITNKKLNTYGPFDRRALFFKQLAKFTSDAGAVGFTVHKNLMYKSLIKKNYEHVISIRFDGYGS